MKFKYNLFRTVFFLVLFLVMDYSYLFTNNGISDYENLTTAIMDSSIGYNNLFYVCGIIVTTIFVIGVDKFLFFQNSSLIVRYGKSRFIKYAVVNIIKDSLLISAEYVGVVVIFCTLRFKWQLLVDTKFYICCLLFVISLFGYFLLVGSVYVFLKILFGFKKISVIITISVFVLLAGLCMFGIEISPVYFSAFVTLWFSDGCFETLEYAINLLKCFIFSFCVYCFSQIIITRKDLIINEE